MVPRLSFAMCDVRDVAAVHITAMTSSKAPGKITVEALTKSSTDSWHVLKHRCLVVYSRQQMVGGRW